MYLEFNWVTDKKSNTDLFSGDAKYLYMDKMFTPSTFLLTNMSYILIKRKMKKVRKNVFLTI
jgi:hypothetical protein